MRKRPLAECKLCLKVRLLCDSHLIPKAFYTRLSKDDGSVYVKRHDGKLLPTPHQAKQYLLCEECEERFSKNGESWIITNSSSNEGFPLVEALRTTQPIGGNDDDGLIYRTDNVPGVSTDQLLYFATSVIWRGSVGTWPQLYRWYKPGKEPALGVNEEPLRLFLLGEAPFPSNGLLSVNACNSAKPALYISFAGSLGAQADGHVQFTFLIPGLLFYMVFNDPLSNYQLSVINNPLFPVIQVGPQVWNWIARRTHK